MCARFFFVLNLIPFSSSSAVYRTTKSYFQIICCILYKINIFFAKCCVINMILAYIADVSERVNIRRTIHEAKSTCRLKSKNNVFLIKVYFSMKVKYLKVMYG